MFIVTWHSHPENVDAGPVYFETMEAAKLHCRRELMIEGNPANKMVISTVNQVLGARVDLTYYIPSEILVTE